MEKLNKNGEKQELTAGLKHRPTYAEFKINLANAAPPPISKPDKAARDKWLSAKERLIPELKTKFSGYE